MGSLLRTAPDGGTAAIGRAEYDDGNYICPDCGERFNDDGHMVESYERFDTLVCEPCFESRCEQVEDGDVR